MYAIIVTGGKQYKVARDQKLKIELLDAEVGSEVKFDKILLVDNGEKVTIGSPEVNGAVVTAKITKHGRAKKIKVFKKKRRKHHVKSMGHRQYFTEIEINDIKAA